MSADKGCPKGMYPLDSGSSEDYETFAELRTVAEGASNSLNLPIAWYFSAPDEYATDEPVSFELTFLMPRKYGATWSLRTESFDRAEVQAWLDTWLRGEINKWFGWLS